MACHIHTFVSRGVSLLVGSLLWIFLLIVAHSADQTRPPAEELRTKVFDQLSRVNTNELQKLTPDQRTILRDYLKKRIRRLEADGNSESDVDGSQETEELALLDDEEGLAMIVRRYLRDPNFNTERLRSINSAKTIGMIGEDLFKEQPLHTQVYDVGIGAAQEWARSNILYLIEKSGKFDEPVRAWAHRMDRENEDDPPGTKIMRDWFRQNEAALKAFDFSKVRPGAEPLPKAATVTLRNLASGTTSNSAASTSSLPIPVNGPATIQVSHNGDATKWIIGGAVVLIALGGVMLATRRRKRPPS